MTTAVMSSGWWPRNTGWSYEARIHELQKDRLKRRTGYRREPREARGEGRHGTAGVRGYNKRHNTRKAGSKRRFDSALRAKFITDCLTFNDSKMMENYIGKKCIVRCYGAGVFFGEVKEVTSDANGLNVRLANARKVWYWDGAAAVEQLSQDGCNDSSKITVAVPELVVASAVQIIPCTDKAIANIESKAEWKR